MTETTTNHEDQLTTEGHRIARILSEATSPEAVARAAVLALLLISDQLADISIEVAHIAPSIG